MSFSGKKYRRIACENIEELFKKSEEKDWLVRRLKCSAPIFSFKQLDVETFIYTLQFHDKSFSHIVKLGMEHEMETLNGSKLKMMYVLENDDVLLQVIKCPGGKEVHFRREFHEDRAEMTVTIAGIDNSAKVIYEVVP